MVQWEAWCCSVPARDGEITTNQRRDCHQGGSDRAWVTWSYTTVTNNEQTLSLSLHSLPQLHTRHLSTFQTYRHIRSDPDYNTTNSKSIKISFIRACPPVGIHFYLSQNIFGFIQIICESNCRMMFHSACYDMMRDAMCQIVRYSQLMTGLTRLPWTLLTLPHICGLWPSDDNTRMWNTKNMRASWAFSVFSAKVMFPWSPSEWDILHVNVVGGAGQRWALHGALKTIPRHYNRRGYPG